MKNIRISTYSFGDDDSTMYVGVCNMEAPEMGTCVIFPVEDTFGVEFESHYDPEWQSVGEGFATLEDAIQAAAKYVSYRS